MTTYRELDSYAKEAFTPALQNLGFKHYRSFNYARVTPKGVHHIIGSQILSSKCNLRIWPFVWVPEFVDEAGKRPDSYPPNSMHTGFPSWKYDQWDDLYSIEDEATARRSLDHILGLLKSFVIPWFDSIVTGADVVDSILPNLRDEAWMKPRIEKILLVYK